MEALFNLECPVGHLSLGQVSVGLMYELYQRGININLFPRSDRIDLASFNKDEDFESWVTESYNNRFGNFQSVPTLSIWHINGSQSQIKSKKNVLWTVHETDSVTDAESKIIKSQDKVFVTSKYTQSVFQNSGLEVDLCENFFDSRHFNKVEIEKKDDVINFGLFGKLEKRKLTCDIMINWAKLYGNNPKYRLNCGIYNHFMSNEQQFNLVNSIFNGKKPWNINIIPFQAKNSDFNRTLNFMDIDLSGLSGAEGWNLPAFQSLCLGKICVFLDAHAHQTYIDDADVIKVTPFSQVPIYDNTFFVEGSQFNQGNMYVFNPESFESATKLAVDKFTIEGKMERNTHVVEQFSVANTCDKLLKELI